MFEHPRWSLLVCIALAGSCSKDPGPAAPPVDAGADATVTDASRVDATRADIGADLSRADADLDTFELPPVPDAPDETATDASRARGFQLYYAERVSRLLLSANRFHFMGDVGWATYTRKARMARTGNDYELLVGPSDNNKIGSTVWNIYNAYRVFRTRELELSLIRLLNGLVFFEEVTGHAGMTSREAYPGWTRVVDGNVGTVSRTRFGTPVASPLTVDASLESEIISTFFAGTLFRYRENPEDFMFALLPAVNVGEYAMTYSFIELPKLIRSGECCSSLMRTPDDKRWAGAYWGNHNSRDNFPDLGLGYLAAKLAAADDSMSPAVRTAAAAAAVGGERIGEAVLASDTSIMTVSNVGDYDTQEISGTIRPHGQAENQDLGSIGACPMAFMAQAMSSRGLEPGIPIPLPGSTDKEFFDTPALRNNLNCDIPDDPVCVALDDGYCGRPWGGFSHLVLQGLPIFEWFSANPALAQALLGSWQNDFDDVAEASMIVYQHAKSSGDAELLAQARRAVFDLTELQNTLSDHAFGDDLDRRAKQRLRSALYKAESDLPVEMADFGDFARWEVEAEAMEGSLTIGDTQPAVLLNDVEVVALIEQTLADSTLPHVVQRYREAYIDGPPIRRTANGYEVKGDDEAVWPWRGVEIPRHRRLGSPSLMDGVVLCEQAPQWLSCDWAALGCRRPDLDGDGQVTSADVTLFDFARATFMGQTCDDGNQWCDESDLDRSGRSDASDLAFMGAAAGCWY